MQRTKPAGDSPEYRLSIQSKQAEAACGCADQEGLSHGTWNRQSAQEGNKASAGDEVEGPGGHRKECASSSRPLRQAWCQSSRHCVLRRCLPRRPSPEISNDPLRCNANTPGHCANRLLASLQFHDRQHSLFLKHSPRVVKNRNHRGRIGCREAPFYRLFKRLFKTCFVGEARVSRSRSRREIAGELKIRRASRNAEIGRETPPQVR